ncbi:hypothetical protein U3516DRAFT_763367 [Neocallimastix sp. 'constans']
MQFNIIPVRVPFNNLDSDSSFNFCFNVAPNIIEEDYNKYNLITLRNIKSWIIGSGTGINLSKNIKTLSNIEEDMCKRIDKNNNLFNWRKNSNIKKEKNDNINCEDYKIRKTQEKTIKQSKQQDAVKLSPILWNEVVKCDILPIFLNYYIFEITSKSIIIIRDINLEDKYRFLIDEYNNEIKKTKQNKTKQKKNNEDHNFKNNENNEIQNYRKYSFR